MFPFSLVVGKCLIFKHTFVRANVLKKALQITNLKNKILKISMIIVLIEGQQYMTNYSKLLKKR